MYTNTDKSFLKEAFVNKHDINNVQSKTNKAYTCTKMIWISGCNNVNQWWWWWGWFLL